MSRRGKNDQGFVLWFTGLPGAGKSAVARRVVQRLAKSGARAQWLDGDVVRQHLTRDLGFSKEDRALNLERVAYVAGLLSKHGVGVVASFVSPYREQRAMVRGMVTNFIEVYMDTPLAICEERDPKGMYKKARAGVIKEFTGVSDPYEPPQRPHLILRGDKPARRINELVDEVIAFLKQRKLV